MDDSDDDDRKDFSDEDYDDQEPTALWRAAALVATPFRALLSTEAKKTYLGAALFFSASVVVFFIAAAAYWVFYLNYVPQVGLNRVVYLQFGHGNPWGTATLGTELASLQKYDVAISLKLPRTPENLAAGNFMLDLELLSPPQNSIIGTNTSTSLIAHSRRPAILTYTSPLMDKVHTLARIPLYLTGWQREAETLDIPMFEDIEFARGWRNVPASLKLEIQSRQQMQVYDMEVRFRAKFSGLRWLMYRWRLLSFIAFTSMFWSVSMISSSLVWLLLSYYWDTRLDGHRRIKDDKTDDDGTSIHDDSNQVSIKNEEYDKIKQEEIEETTNLPPLSSQAEDGAEDVETMAAVDYDHDSGQGTALEGHEMLGAQRRRSHFSRLVES